MKTFLVIVYASLKLISSSTSAAAATLEMREAWIREAPPTASVLAAYMVISNTGETPAEITAMASPDFDHTELHRTVVEGGVARMVPIEKLELPAGEMISLEPGGIHLMLIDPLRPLREGDTVTLVIRDADGFSKTFTVPVIRETGEVDQSHH